MPTRPVQVHPAPGDGAATAELRARFEAVRAENEVPAAFPDEVVSEARQAVRSPLRLPEEDLTSLPLLTIDPPGSMDLDQAVHLQRDGAGYRVRYAIADVPAFVEPGGAIDGEARRRGQTIYAPDQRTPLHPPVVSEDAASLLPGRVRPAYVWDISLDEAGQRTAAQVRRAMVRSRQRWDYESVQQAIDAGTAGEVLLLLQEVGEKRVELERLRGGASLPMPEQEVVEDSAGRFSVGFRPPLAVEEWNAQISLLTGMAAADLMLQAGVGILRTMPAPDPGVIERLRRAARGLGIAWADDQPYGEFLRSLDRDSGRHLALIHEARSLFRGAGYTPLDGATGHDGDGLAHAAVAAPYAHVTAPLRRLVDRFGLVVCEAVCAGRSVPQWVRDALPALPETMAASDRRAGAVERACADAVEAAVLRGRLGEVFGAVVVDRRNAHGVLLQIDEPAVLAAAEGLAEPGARVTARLVVADIASSTVRFQILP